MRNVCDRFGPGSAWLGRAPGLGREYVHRHPRHRFQQVQDGKTMVFKMKDGRTLVNHLHGICPDLKFNGFAWQSAQRRHQGLRE